MIFGKNLSYRIEQCGKCASNKFSVSDSLANIFFYVNTNAASERLKKDFSKETHRQGFDRVYCCFSGFQVYDSVPLASAQNRTEIEL